MNIFGRHLAPALLAFLASPAAPSGAQTAGKHFPLTSAVIVAALQAAGLAAAASDVELPLSLSASAEAPALRITGAELVEEKRMRVRLSCSNAGECLPFFVIVNLPKSGKALEQIAALNSSSQADLPMRKTSGSPLRPGDRITLLMENEHMRIALPVVSMDSGTVGSEVRVSSPDHKKVFRATVVSAQIVKGDLP